MGQKDHFRAGPLFCGSRDLLSLDLILVEVGNSTDYDPGKTPAKIYNLVHDEAHDPGGKDIVLHICVPALYQLLGDNLWRSELDSTYGPETFENVQVNIVLGQLGVYSEIGIRSGEES